MVSKEANQQQEGNHHNTTIFVSVEWQRQSASPKDTVHCCLVTNTRTQQQLQRVSISLFVEGVSDAGGGEKTLNCS